MIAGIELQGEGLQSTLSASFVPAEVLYLKANENDEWVETDFDECVEKVTQFYRTKQKSIKKSNGS